VNILPQGCDVKDIDTIRDYVLPHLDGSPASLRIAMIHLADCKSLYDAMKSASGDSKGRAFYSTLLMLAIHVGHYRLYDSTKTTFNRDISKVN
jgi:5-hydroxyisourate hydrolase-like protein (transthyretin family)